MIPAATIMGTIVPGLIMTAVSAHIAKARFYWEVKMRHDIFLEKEAQVQKHNRRWHIAIRTFAIASIILSLAAVPGRQLIQVIADIMELMR